MKVTLIVQARSNSTRLKNKMFLTLGKYKILEWVPGKGEERAPRAPCWTEPPRPPCCTAPPPFNTFARILCEDGSP